MRDRENILKHTGNPDIKEEAFREILTHRNSVFLICMGYTHNIDDAEELTQDIFVKAWEKLDRLEKIASVKGWIITITRNRCIDHVRKTKVRNLFIAAKDHASNSVFDNNSPEEEIIFESQKGKLKECVHSLPEKLRSIFILKEYSGYSCEEISEILNLKLGTVHSRLSRGRKKVTKLMEIPNG